MKIFAITAILFIISWKLNAQIALPTFQAVHTPHSFGGRMIAGGIFHNGAILANGIVKFWGYNNYGQLGQGNTNNIGDGSNEMGDNLSVIDLSSSSDVTLD